MTAGTHLAEELRHAISTVALAELPELLGVLEAERVRGLMRIGHEAAPPSSSRVEDVQALLTMSEVAARLGVSLEHARELGRRLQLPTVRVGQRYVRVRRAALEAFIEQRERSAQRLATPSTRAEPLARRVPAPDATPRSPRDLKEGKLINLPPRQPLRTSARLDPTSPAPRRLLSRSRTDNDDL